MRYKVLFLKKIVWGISSWAILFLVIPIAVLPWYVFVYLLFDFPQGIEINEIKVHFFDLIVPFPFSLMLLSVINGTVMLIPYLTYEKLRNVNLFDGYRIPYPVLLLSLILFQVMRIIEVYLTDEVRWLLFSYFFFSQLSYFLFVIISNALVWYVWQKLTFLLRIN